MVGTSRSFQRLGPWALPPCASWLGPLAGGTCESWAQTSWVSRGAQGSKGRNSAMGMALPPSWGSWTVVWPLGEKEEVKGWRGEFPCKPCPSLPPAAQWEEGSAELQSIAWGSERSGWDSCLGQHPPL